MKHKFQWAGKERDFSGYKYRCVHCGFLAGPGKPPRMGCKQRKVYSDGLPRVWT